MTVETTHAALNDVRRFRADAYETATALDVLSVAVKLTDSLAVRLLREAGLEAEAPSLVAALHMCDFVIERGGEWEFAERALIDTASNNSLEPSHIKAIHASLSRVSDSAGVDEGLALPRYLLEGVGGAYHRAFYDQATALNAYAGLAIQAPADMVLLAHRLAKRQVQVGVLPAYAPAFRLLAGVAELHAGNHRGAIDNLLSAYQLFRSRTEGGWALALLGRLQAVLGDYALAWRLYEGSAHIFGINGENLGLAQSLYGLGSSLVADGAGRHRSRNMQQAQEALSACIELAVTLEDDWLHLRAALSLGQLFGQKEELEDAEEWFRHCLALSLRVQDEYMQSQVYWVWARAVRNVDRSRAKELFLTAGALKAKIGDDAGVNALVVDQHSF